MNALNHIKENDNGDIIYTGWIEWKHIPTGIYHCLTCLALDNCWFSNLKKPMLPQHEKCHCVAIFIDRPIANETAKAICDLSKFTDYIFSDKYAWNGKGELFKELGFTERDAQYLQAEYEKQAVVKYCNGEYEMDRLNEYGQRINIEINFYTKERDITFISGWMVRPKGTITNNTPLAD